VIAAVLFCAALSASAPEPAAPHLECVPDAVSLLDEARARLAGTDPEPPPDALAAARRLVRSARRLATSPDLDFFAADLAFAAGDEEEGGDLLASAAETSPDRLSDAELLLVARRAEERRRWTEAGARYRELARRLSAEGQSEAWIETRLREIELDAQAESIAPPPPGPPIEARLALAEGKRLLSAGRLREARESLRTALDLAPSYVEALLALGAVEARSGRTRAAIRAYHDALAAEPDRVDAMTSLANLLWEQPDRAAKAQSLALLDRASALPPNSRALLRVSAERWAEYGDASRAQERLDRFLAKASSKEREETAPLREALARQRRPEPTPAPVPVPEEPGSSAADRWRKAQVLAARGDAESQASALALLAEAEALDPTLARAPELAAAIHERRSEWKDAEDALGRAIRADPSRATAYESLARLLERDSARAADASRAWERAAEAGSSEALMHRASEDERDGRTSEALTHYRRYLAEAPAGMRSAEAQAAVLRIERARTARLFSALALAGLVLLAAATAAYRVRTGSTFSEWLSREPGRAAEARRIVGRLRHEALKHGGLLLSDGADRLEGADPVERRGAADLLVTRLYGAADSRGLVAEASEAIVSLLERARSDGVRLNLAHRDPEFSLLIGGLRDLRKAQAGLRRVANGGTVPERAVRRVARLLRDAARSFQLASGAELERSIGRAAALPVRLDALRALLAHVAAESDREAPPLEVVGGPDRDDGLPAVRLSAADWETLWRNLFGNALAAGRLGISASGRRDAITGEARLHVVLFDDVPGTPTRSDLRDRPPDRGLGVVAEILRRNDGSIEVVEPDAPGFTKGIRVDLPTVEGPA
jgi:cytochrome c-type biogenesis protein CcmH/NrfG